MLSRLNPQDGSIQTSADDIREFLWFGCVRCCQKPGVHTQQPCVVLSLLCGFVFLRLI